MTGIELTTEILVLPTGMPLDHNEISSFGFRVTWRGPYEDGRGGYAVICSGRHLSRAGNLAYDPAPFKQHQYRWETMEEALEMARKYVDSRTINGKTFAQWQVYLKNKAEENS